MKALVWHGKEDIRDTVSDPEIEDPRDAIVKITSCAKSRLVSCRACCPVAFFSCSFPLGLKQGGHVSLASGFAISSMLTGWPRRRSGVRALGHHVNHATSVRVGAPLAQAGALQLFGIFRGGRFQFATPLLHGLVVRRRLLEDLQLGYRVLILLLVVDLHAEKSIMRSAGTLLRATFADVTVDDYNQEDERLVSHASRGAVPAAGSNRRRDTTHSLRMTTTAEAGTGWRRVEVRQRRGKAGNPALSASCSSSRSRRLP